MKFKSLIRLVLALCALAVLTADAYAESFRHIGEQDGLPNRRTFAVETDADGFVWIYTESGLCRYDGTEFRNYRLDGLNRQHGYAPFATTLTRSKEGHILLTVNSGMVYRYNPVLDRFEKIADMPAQGKELRINSVYAHGDSVLVCTDNGVYINGDSVSDFLTLHGRNVHHIRPMADKRWMASTADGMYIVEEAPEGQPWKASLIDNTCGINFGSMVRVGDRFIAGTFADGIFKVGGHPVRAERIEGTVPLLPVTDITPAADERIYVAVDGAGVYLVDLRDGKTKKRYSYDSSGRRLSANTVSDLSNDGHGGLWISTSSHGLNHLTADDRPVTLVCHDQYNQNSLIAECVNAVFQDSDGDMWYGTDAGLSLRRRDGSWSHYLTRIDDVDNTVLTISQSASGKIYTGGYGLGAWTIDKHTGAANRLPSRRDGRGIGTEYIYDIYCEGDNVWFGGIQGALTFYDASSDSYRYFPSECITDIVAPGDSSLYVAGCEGIGRRITPDSISWSRNPGSFELYSIPRSLSVDSSRNEMWCATDGQGIIILDLSSGKVRRFVTGKDNNPENIFGLTVDHDGKIWFYTENDLYVVSSDRRRVGCVTPLLNMSGISFMPRAIIIDRDGNLVIGSTSGALTVRTDLDYDSKEAPVILLTDLTVNHQPVLPAPDDALLPVAVNEMERLRLPYDHNNFTLHISALTSGSGNRLAYSWRLKEYDDEWQPLAASRDIVCRNIPSGKYTLEIRCTDMLTGDVIAERELGIDVALPLWLTWWAWALYIIIFAAVIVVVVRYVRRRQREQRITEKIQSFLNIVHDLRTPVTLIKAPLSEIDNQDDLSDETRKNVRLAMNNVERLLTMIGRLLDLRRESNHSDCLNLSETNIREFLESKVAEWRVAAIQKGLQIKLSLPDAMPAVMIDCNKISHVLDNLVSNAIKYTFSGSVTLKAAYDRKYWSLVVSDTGIGIPSRDRRRLFHSQYRGSNAVSTDEIGSGMGLLIVHRLVLLHKGKITVASRENDGTEFTIRLPLTFSSPVRRIPDADTSGTESEPVSAAEGKETLMLIDDEQEILDYLADSLSDTYNIVKFTDASDALQVIDSISPDIVVSDVKLKGMSGFELCQRLKSSMATSHIPVILLSALSERQNIILGLESGANDYIVKPFDISVLRLRIRNILNIRRQLQSKVVSQDEPSPEDEMSSIDMEFLRRVIASIDTNIDNSEYSIADLCGEIAMSRTAVYNKIKALTGESINDYIKIRRLNKAKEMIASHKHSISEVAYMVGFSDPKYFSTCFKKQFGVSPSKL